MANPFQDPLRFERRVPECAIVIFGANGDLTKRKLIPALYRLAYDRRSASGFAIVGNSRTGMSDEAFRDKMHEAVKEFPEDTPFDDRSMGRFLPEPVLLRRRPARSGYVHEARGTARRSEASRHTGGNVLFYLSTQPSQYEAAIKGIGYAKLQQGSGWRRIVVEKPFGHDLASARELNSASCTKSSTRSDVYRIDHYLGKETVQNILAFRFGNGIFEPLWNRRYINHVQITAAESIGVEGRGAYYQEAGALARHDPESPAAGDGDDRDGAERRFRTRRRARRARQAAALDPHHEAGRGPHEQRCRAVRPGAHRRRGCPGFRQEPGVDPNAQTDTYAAVTFFVDNWRWAGVPFYIRTGKRLPKRVTEIAIQFKPAPHSPFR